MCHNVLSLRRNLYAKKLVKYPLYPIFGLDDETREHAFLLSPWITPVWFELPMSKVPTELSVTSRWQWLYDFMVNSVKGDTGILSRINFVCPLEYLEGKE